MPSEDVQPGSHIPFLHSISNKRQKRGTMTLRAMSKIGHLKLPFQDLNKQKNYEVMYWKDRWNKQNAQ